MSQIHFNGLAGRTKEFEVIDCGTSRRAEITICSAEKFTLTMQWSSSPSGPEWEHEQCLSFEEEMEYSKTEIDVSTPVRKRYLRLVYKNKGENEEGVLRLELKLAASSVVHLIL